MKTPAVAPKTHAILRHRVQKPKKTDQDEGRGAAGSGAGSGASAGFAAASASAPLVSTGRAGRRMGASVRKNLR
jgi:hypothetical protein